MEAETGVIWPQVSEHWEPLEGEGMDSPRRLCREQGPADTSISDFRPPEL